MHKETLIIISIAISFALGLSVYLRNRKNLVNKSFFHFVIVASLWSLALYFYTHPIILSSLAWIKITYFLSAFTAPAFLYFCTAFSGKPLKLLIKPLSAYFILSSPLIYTLFFTQLWVKEVIQTEWGYHTITGPAYPIFGALAGVCLFWSIELLLQKIARDNELEKNQTKYILIGIALYAFFSFLVDVAFPIFFGVSKYFWTSPVYSFFFVIFTALAITKYHLFEIKVIVTEILVVIMAIILVVQAVIVSHIKIIDYGILFLFILIGYLLVKSTHREIKRREEVEKLADRLEDANVQIKSVDKMKSDLLNMASHEFRTPLSAVKNALWFLNKEDCLTRLEEKEKTNLARINKSIERFDYLLENINNMLQMTTGKLELDIDSVQLERIILEVIENKQVEAQEKQIELKFVEPTEVLPPIMADATKLKYVFWELVTNALKYTEPNDKITIKACHVVRERHGLAGKRWLEISIADTGKGIPEEQIAQLFNAFDKVDFFHTTQPGLGLGLYIIKQIIDLHGGQISVESQVDKGLPAERHGTKFTISLPVQPESEGTVVGEKTSADAPNKNSSLRETMLERGLRPEDLEKLPQTS
ncbi:hypothetical protein KKB83_02455 [Patescibacteria group bacterium]|nr:hypothetical protein [Patescibacteria group bacterium]